jgi:SAM-dependent methyltransferase
LIARADPEPGERVLDVACGTGIVARLAAGRVEPSGRVIGLDLNPAMLSVARAVAEREHRAVVWRGAACGHPERARGAAVPRLLGRRHKAGQKGRNVMSLRPNVEVVGRIYEALKERDVPAALAFLAPDILIEQSEEVPWGGTPAATTA